MNDLVSYLLAQARYRPMATARFAAGEIWRRSRLRLVHSLEKGLPTFSSYELQKRLTPFLPAGALDAREFGANHLRAAEMALRQAEAVRRHEFNIFGEQVSCGPRIDWHADWKSSHRWPLGRAGELAVVDAAPGADIKRPWELARFHHLLPLGKAFLLTRDAQHAAEFSAQVLDWMAQNPCPRGIHWAMPLEVAVRAVNWISSAAFFAEGGVLEESFWQEFLRSLFLHGRFLFAHHEWNPVARGNHYLGCVTGLLYLGVFFHDQPEAQRWREFARRELLREMQAQVREDGAAHEGSSGYHAFLAELFLSSALLLARFDSVHRARPAPAGVADVWAQVVEGCGQPFAARLEKMFNFLAALCAGRERPPILGDSDDGRLLPLCSAEGSAAEHLLCAGRELFGRADWPATHDCEEVWWRLGGACEARSAPANRAACAAYPQSGYFFFSSPRIRGSVRCGPLGINGWANHAHCDQLSYEFCWEGKTFLVDPGTYLYSGDSAGRNLFRSTRYHNTPVVNGEEQNRFWPGLLFRIVDDTRSRLHRWSADDSRVEFAGDHRGYRRRPGRGVRVERRLVLDRRSDGLFVTDLFRGRRRARLEWYLHFAPGIEVERLEPEKRPAPPSLPEGEEREAWRAGDILVRLWTGPRVPELKSAVERGWVAPRYGQRAEAAVVRVRCEVELGRSPVSVTFSYQPMH